MIVGSGGVGKSCLTVLLVHDYFVENYDPTIEDSYRKQIPVDGIPCLLHILDTAGQEDFSAMRDQYMREGQGFLVVFSLTKRTSFQDIEVIRQRIFRAKDTEQVPIVVAGNKIDLVEARQVSMTDAQEYCRRIGCPFFATSARTGHNVEQVFSELIRVVRKDQQSKGTSRRKPRSTRCSIL